MSLMPDKKKLPSGQPGAKKKVVKAKCKPKKK